LILGVAPFLLGGFMIKRKWKLFQERVAEFFETVQRTGADIKHNIIVVKTERYHDFVDFILKSPKVEDKYKLIIILQLSTASRISEILNLKKKDFDLGATPLVTIKVLKKRLTRIKDGVTCSVTPKERIGVVDPKILPLIKELVENLSDNDYIFSNRQTKKPYSRVGVWLQYQQMMGTTTHGFRHSRINYIFEEQNYSVEDVANLLLFSTREIAYTYHNTNIKKTALRLAEKEKHKVA